MDTQRFAKEFREKGYIELPAFFSRREVDDLLSAMRDAKQCETGRGRLDDEGLIFNHNLYFHNPPIQKFVSQKKIIDVLVPLVGPDIWIRWDQLVTKQPGGVEFPWHQDNGYNGLKNEHYQFWMALSESKPENGGLWLVPGSHKWGLLPHEWVGKHKVWQGKVEEEVAISAEPGDAVLFSSMLLHRTKPNMSNIPRLAYILEYMSTKDYDPELKPPYFMVAKNGVPAAGFANTYAGRQNPLNYLKYARLLPQFAKRMIKQWVSL
jgi:ectoine hydroxylase-related dioxygenase (phytanoyl-CoA dioxygenase family)